MSVRTLVVDRIEGDVAVLTDGTYIVDLPLAWLPDDVAEGWHLRVELTRDPIAEAAARDETAARIRHLSRDDDGGDFSL